MGHYRCEMYYEGEEEDMRRIEEKYARMSWKEIQKIKKETFFKTMELAEKMKKERKDND